MKPDFYEISSYILEHSDNLEMLKKGHSNYPPQIFFEISCGVLLQHMLNKMPGTYDIYDSEAKYKIKDIKGFSGLCEFFKLNNKKLFNKPDCMDSDENGFIHLNKPLSNVQLTISSCIFNFDKVIARYGLASLKNENQYGSPIYVKDLSSSLGTEPFLYTLEYLYKPGVIVIYAFSAVDNNPIKSPCFYRRFKTEGLDDYSAIGSFENVDFENFLIAHLRHASESKLIDFFSRFKFSADWIDTKLTNLYTKEKEQYFNIDNSLSTLEVLKVLMAAYRIEIDSKCVEQIIAFDLDYKTAKQFMMSKQLSLDSSSNSTDINLTY